jgi:tocopherol O-methyltransferase
MDRTVSRNQIVEYYQSSQWLYRLFVYSSRTLGMHYGFWDSNTKNRQQAIMNENEEVIRIGHITSNMRILDAGCGVGGTAIYIAQTTGASMWGISLDPQQIRLAKQYAQKRGAAPLTHFSTQDYTQTNFPDNFFDVVFGIESICYASPKNEFLEEAYRILKPGGTLVVQDGYISRPPKTPQEHRILKDFTWAWALPQMITNAQMCREMSRAGFIQNRSIDFTKEVLPTVRYFRRWHTVMQLVCRLTKHIPIEPIHAIYRNYLAFIAIENGYRIGLAAYWEQYGQKPLKNGNRNPPTERAKEKIQLHFFI